MIRRLTLFALVFCSFASARGDDKNALKIELKRIDAGLGVFRAGKDKPILVYNAPPDGRPFVHPIVAPDGKGVLTEFSPAHHKHQTGIYVGILKVNGRDYFHNRGGDYYSFKSASVSDEGTRVRWTYKYNWLDKDKQPILLETQDWACRDLGTHYVLDLDWSARADVDVTCAKYDYGGLFVRMPWTAKTGGEAVNSDGKKNGQAEGQRARWVDIGVPIEGRDDWGHIAILDHKDNPGHPIPWRVDGQLGVGPSRSRLGDWKIPKGETAKARYRFVIYTGKTDAEKVEALWKEFTR